MTFYQELQLSSTGSKQLIRSTTDPKEKRRHILIYNFKVYLVMAFCVAVVTLPFIFPNKHGNLHLVSTGGMSVICSIYGIMKNDQADMIFLEQGKLNDDIIYLLIGLWGLSLLMIFFIKLIIDRIFDNRKKKLTDMNDTSL